MTACLDADPEDSGDSCCAALALLPVAACCPDSDDDPWEVGGDCALFPG